MKKYSWILILLNAILLLIYFNYSVYDKEQILKNGQLILLELAPVDPRSLIQGDFMQLNYTISQIEENETPSRKGFCVLKSDTHGLAQKIRLQEKPTPLNEGEILLKYTSKNTWAIRLGAESYFFQEGKAKLFEKAEYGGLRVDKKGNSVLVGLYDENFKLLE